MEKMKTISYQKLISKLPLKQIKNAREYKKAIKFYEELIDNYSETDELNDYLNVLSMLIDNYENEKYPIEDADPVDIMKFLMEEKNIKQAELAKAFGSQSVVSEVLNRKRGLTLKYIYNMADVFNVRPQIFV
jgi:HTH-type transcriptional regulator/antitoxin HigA